MVDSNDWMKRVEAKTSEQLAGQSLTRELSGAERTLAEALESIFADGVHDFDKVAAELTKRSIAAPGSGRTEWDLESLTAELKAINDDLDVAYGERGFGA